MDMLRIKGGRSVRGQVGISGSKNAALPILIASLLTDERCVIENVPRLADIENTIALLVFLGKQIAWVGDTVTIDAGPTLYAEAPYEIVRRMRASVVVMGPLLARLKHAKVSLPGGCAIGGRPINIHLDGFKALGIDIRLKEGFVEGKSRELKGTDIHFNFASVGATENLMMAATLARGTTVLHNAAKEPEIDDLARFLKSMGAKIEGAGTDTIRIHGVQRLRGTTHSVIPDRIEAGTFMIAGAFPGCDVTVTNMEPSHLGSLCSKLKRAGAKVTVLENSIRVQGPRSLKAVDIETAIYPGFPTDLQAQWMSLMAVAQGVTQITETVFENRFMHVGELQRMGAQVQVKDRTATVVGVAKLSGAPVMASDLRAGAALVLSALSATGESKVLRIYHLDRGYERLEEKLRRLGVQVQRTAQKG